MAESSEKSALQISVNEVSQELKIRPEIYIKILSSFSTTLDGKLDALRTAIPAGDKETIRKVLHEIKGTSSNLRINNIGRVESLMHDEVKGGANPQLLSQYLDELEMEIGRLKDALQRIQSQAAA